jgi:catechol 2,3-dioxygenase-like lactoylglutathione lyase family enzyme
MNRPALVPELYVSNYSTSLIYYVELVGFEVLYDRPEDRFAALALGRAQLMIEETASLQAATSAQIQTGEWRPAALEIPFGRGINFEIRVPGVSSIYERLEFHSQPVLLGPHDKKYRVGDRFVEYKTLLVADPDGYLLRFVELISDNFDAK